MVKARELGPRNDLEVRRRLGAEIHAGRWTGLDRAIAAEAARHDRVVDLRPEADHALDGDIRSALVGRMRKLERLGLAEPLGSARWYLSERAEPTLRVLGERSDIIKRIHRGLAELRIERSLGDYVLEGADLARPIIGRLIARGLDDELQGSAYAVIDGTDGRTHHVRLPDLDATSDSAPGSIVELRRFKDSRGRERTAIAVRSDLRLAAQRGSDRRHLARPSAARAGAGGAQFRRLWPRGSTGHERACRTPDPREPRPL
jgi:type IV secretory pathway VirD2 relaxase